MKIMKRILAMSLTVLVVCGGLFAAISIMLGDERINGFVGTTGIIRTELSGDLYTVLDADPIKILIREKDLDEFLKTYFDTVDMLYFSGHGEKDGILYQFMSGSFTGDYLLVRMVEVEDPSDIVYVPMENES